MGNLCNSSSTNLPKKHIENTTDNKAEATVRTDGKKQWKRRIFIDTVAVEEEYEERKKQREENGSDSESDLDGSYIEANSNLSDY